MQEHDTACGAASSVQPEQDQLRFLTCGSVDDGKSTLIGRLLHDAGLLYDDQLATLYKLSNRLGRTRSEPDFSLLLDGLLAEQEQGITIDVAYRQFATASRRFIVADAPGHEQYTPNMVTAASTSDVAVLLLDARAGLLPQTRRHARIAALMGIRHVALAINKMDLVNYSEEIFTDIRLKFEQLAALLHIPHTVCIPVSALKGDNVVHPSEAMPWYHGPRLLEYLETVTPAISGDDLPLRLPVQWINFPDAGFRGASGTIASGLVRVGDPISIVGSGVTTRVDRILGSRGEQEEALAGEPVTLTFADQVDVSRGHMLAAPENQPDTADVLDAEIIWMGRDPLVPGRNYILKLGPMSCTAAIAGSLQRFNIDTQTQDEASTLEFNEIGRGELRLSASIPFEPYDRHRLLGGFILIDPFSRATVGAGLIRKGRSQASNITWHNFSVTGEDRAQAKGQKACVLWFTGLSASGKSTVADLVERGLFALGKHTYTLDGDNVRHGLNHDLGFSPEDRVENIRRVAEVTKLMVDAGLIVLVTFISPFRNERQMARELFQADEFFEIFVDTPLEVCQQRDPKGLYRMAREGKIADLTGIGSPYEAPEHPELVLNGGEESPEALAAQILAFLGRRNILPGYAGK